MFQLREGYNRQIFPQISYIYRGGVSILPYAVLGPDLAAGHLR